MFILSLILSEDAMQLSIQLFEATASGYQSNYCFLIGSRQRLMKTVASTLWPFSALNYIYELFMYKNNMYLMSQYSCIVVFL